MLRYFIAFTAICLTCAQNLLFEPVSDGAPKPCCSSDKLFEVTMSYLGATMQAGNADAIVVSSSPFHSLVKVNLTY